MKRFVKTLPGKVLLFILCVVSVCVLTASSILALFFTLEDDLNVYTMTRKEYQDTYACSHRLVLRRWGRTLSSSTQIREVKGVCKWPVLCRLL